MLTGIKQELDVLLGYYSFAFEKKNRVYRSLTHPDLYAATTGPGIRKKKEIRKILNQIKPDIIINAGLVGVLETKHEAMIGDRVTLHSVRNSSSQITYPGGKGKNTLVSIDYPVFSPSQKLDLALDFHSQVCDMEAALLIEMAGQLETIRDDVLVIFCKIVGDRPENYQLFMNESLVWGWKHYGFWKKLYCGLRFPGGPFHLDKLLSTKKIALESLCSHANILIQSLIDNQGIGKNIDSIFVPH